MSTDSSVGDEEPQQRSIPLKRISDELFRSSKYIAVFCFDREKRWSRPVIRFAEQTMVMSSKNGPMRCYILWLVSLHLELALTTAKWTKQVAQLNWLVSVTIILAFLLHARDSIVVLVGVHVQHGRTSHFRAETASLKTFSGPQGSCCTYLILSIDSLYRK